MSAQKLLGSMFSRGNEIGTDNSLAVHYYLMAAEKGDNVAIQFVQNAETRVHLNAYLSLNWRDTHSRLSVDTRKAVREMFFVLDNLKDNSNSRLIPKELSWLIGAELIKVWPVSAYKDIKTTPDEPEDAEEIIT